MFKADSLTTTQINALTPENGLIVYNSTTQLLQKVENGRWVTVGSASGPIAATPIEIKTYLPGSFIVPTQSYLLLSQHLILTGSQTVVLSGTAQLRMV